jgi:transcription initiation factor TFIIH subunit 2
MARWSGPVRLEEVPEDLKEDEATGTLRLVVSKAARKHDELASTAETAVRRGVIRFLVLVIDSSEKMNERDMRPTRLSVTQKVVSTFIDNYFDQNPISQLAIVELRKGNAEKITELSGNARHHKKKLEQHMEAMRERGSGMPSMRAGLELALQVLEMQASYGTREVLMIYGSLSTSDRGDIFRTVDKIKTAGIKVSTVGVMAELYVAKAVSEQTGGNYSIATHAMQLQEMVLRLTKPPPVLEIPGGGPEKPAAGMWVGFPVYVKSGPVVGWQCPRCHDVVPDVPVDCQVF